MINETKKIVLLNILVFVLYYALAVYLTNQKHIHDYRFLQKAVYLATYMSIHSAILIFTIIFNFVKGNKEKAKLFGLIQLILLLIGFPVCFAPI